MKENTVNICLRVLKSKNKNSHNSYCVRNVPLCPGRTFKAANKRQYHKHPSQHDFNDNVGNGSTLLSQPVMSSVLLPFDKP